MNLWGLLVSALHLAVGGLGLQTHTTAPSFTWLLGIQAQAPMLAQKTSSSPAIALLKFTSWAMARWNLCAFNF